MTNFIKWGPKGLTSKCQDGSGGLLYYAKQAELKKKKAKKKGTKKDL